MKPKTIIPILLIAIVSLMTTPTTLADPLDIDQSNITVDITNTVVPYLNFAYNQQLLDADPLNKDARYRLELLTQSYSTNGLVSGLKAGMDARRGTYPEYTRITFTHNNPSWRPSK